MGNLITWDQLKEAATELDFQILYRDIQGTLWGIPYDLKSGQQPADIRNRQEWCILDDSDQMIRDFLAKYKDALPTQRNAWVDLDLI